MFFNINIIFREVNQMNIKKVKIINNFASLNNIASIMDCITRNELYLNNEF